MQYYMIKSAQIKNKQVNLSKDDLHHIYHVMRYHVGDKIMIVDYETQKKYECLLIDNEGTIKINHEVAENNELSHELVLVYAMVKSDKMELVIQKACELGVSKFIPFYSNRVQIKWDEKKLAKKYERWQKIIKEACEQARRNTLMELVEPIKQDQLLNYLCDINIVAYELEDALDVEDVYLKDNSCLVMVGPEGGYDEQEITFFKSLEIKSVSLGKRILRTETAAINILSIVANIMK